VNRALEALRDALSDLETAGARFALVGGIAVSVVADPRFTAGVDVVVSAPDDTDANRLIGRLAKAGRSPSVFVEQETTGRLAMVRFIDDHSDVCLDLLFASSGIEAEIVEAATTIEIVAGVCAPVARIGHLIALKLLSEDPLTRPTDTQDLRALAGLADADELGLARTACRLITDRGYDRGRDLLARLDALIS